MKFCFYGNISPTLRGQTLGGAELQISLLSKALAIKGHEVVIIDPTSSESFSTAEGVKLINIPNWNRGLRGIRLFWFRIPSLWRIMNKQKADYYYVRTRDYFHIIPYLVARKRGVKFIQAIAHDLDVLGFSNKFNVEYKRKFNLFKFLSVYVPGDIVNSYLLRKSDYVILQHAGQKLHKNSVRGKVVIFSNIIDYSKFPKANNDFKGYFIYIGSLTILKGIDKLYELVNIIDKKFKIVVVGRPVGEEPGKIFEALQKKENVILKGQIGHDEVIALTSNAIALINTSYAEGFPNIFLEAWSAGIPIISLSVNPGNVFNEHKLGVCCNGDLTKMKSCIEGNELENIDKEQLVKYVSTFHDFKTAADRFLAKINGS